MASFHQSYDHHALAKYARFHSHDLGEIGRHTGFLSGGAVQVKPEKPDGLVTLFHRQVDLPRISLILFEYHCSNGGVVFRAPETRQYYILEYCISGSAVFEQDGIVDHVEADDFVLRHPDSPTSGTLSAGSQHLLVNIDRKLLESTLAKHLGHISSDKIIFSQRRFSVRDQGNGIATLLKSLCGNLESEFPVLGEPSVSRQFEDMLCSLLLNSLDNNYSAALRDGESPVPYYVRRVENFVRSQASEELSFADLVSASGVSSRTLHEGFRRFRGTTPMSFLKNIRLEMAHAQLRKVDGESVTKVALACGFTHLSKFSIEYRRRFGEKPSDTLRRRQSGMS